MNLGMASAVFAAVVLTAPALAEKPGIPANISAAVADPARPEADRARDAERKPAGCLAFADVKHGDRVADLIPGGGYFTRLFSVAVGPKGYVYAYLPSNLDKRMKKPSPVYAIAANPHYANVSVIHAPVEKFVTPEKLDLVWTSQNYHDLHDSFFGPADIAAVNKAIYAALKPGGIYIVLDHAAAPGSGLRDTETLHRIDEAAVKKEAEAAGFKLVAESSILRNPADTHALKVFDPSIRGHTDQFILKFRRPRG